MHVIMKTTCPFDCDHSGFVTIYSLGYAMFSYTLLIAMFQSVLNKLKKQYNWLYVMHDTHIAQISQKQDGRNI